MAGATEESNEKHLEPWSVGCHRDGVANTPLSPYMDQELLYNRYACPLPVPACLACLCLSLPVSAWSLSAWSLLAAGLSCRHLHIDGAKLEATGFKYEVTEVTVALLREVCAQCTHCTARPSLTLPLSPSPPPPLPLHPPPSPLTHSSQVVDDFVSSGLFPSSLVPPPPSN